MERSDHLHIPKRMSIVSIFSRQSHDEASRSQSHDVLFTMKVIRSIINSKDGGFYNLI